MADSDWRFLCDENVGRVVAQQLTQRGYHADLVVDVLEPGVTDDSDVLPYAREHDLVVVTKDCSDFAALSPAEHEGLILVGNHQHAPVDLAAAIDVLVEAYPSRKSFRGQQEFIDDWIR
jgi:hypothetical protein